MNFEEKKCLLRYNSHTLQFTDVMSTTQWFLVYSKSCATITIINFETYHSKKKHHTL